MAGTEVEELRAIQDPVRRARRATEIIDSSEAMTEAVRAIRLEALETMRGSGMLHADIARAAGLTRARVSQLLGSARLDRALLAPEPGGALAIAVVQKRDPGSGQPVIGSTTRKALDKLKNTALSLGIISEEEEVAPPGIINLNRSNLAVMIGPRISALIAQALSSDPVIRWQPDRGGRWYITDMETGVEYHSDYDDGWHGPLDRERACVAHIGRLRRPDGRGTFLYLGGAHSPGTAGAVEYFTREMPVLWEQVRRSPVWSAVVRTVTDGNGSPVSAELASPVYTHGKAS